MLADIDSWSIFARNYNTLPWFGLDSMNRFLIVSIRFVMDFIMDVNRF